MSDIVEQASGFLAGAAGLVALVLGFRLAGIIILWLIRSMWIRTPPTID